jgi:hypothetical protein
MIKQQTHFPNSDACIDMMLTGGRPQPRGLAITRRYDGIYVTLHNGCQGGNMRARLTPDEALAVANELIAFAKTAIWEQEARAEAEIPPEEIESEA